jgi:hypothetical protein
MEKRLQKRIIVKARGSFALEDFELRSPSQKTPLDRSDADREGDRADRRRRRRKKLGPPAEVAAMLEEEERSSAASQEEEPVRDEPDSRNDGRAQERRVHDAEVSAGDSASGGDVREQAGTSEVTAGAESQQGVAPIAGNTTASSGTEQVVVDTTAVSPSTDEPKPQS